MKDSYLAEANFHRLKVLTSYTPKYTIFHPTLAEPDFTTPLACSVVSGTDLTDY